MKQPILLAAGLAAIAFTAACAKGPEHLQAGEWEMKIKFTAVDAQGAPPQELAQARAMLGQERTIRSCVSPEEAANPLSQVRRAMTQMPAGAGCTTDEDRFAGGVIRLRATCRSTVRQIQATIAMDGSFSETTLQATSVMNAQIPGPTGGTQSMSITQEVRGIRVGDCPGSSRQPGNSL